MMTRVFASLMIFLCSTGLTLAEEQVCSDCHKDLKVVLPSTHPNSVSFQGKDISLCLQCHDSANDLKFSGKIHALHTKQANCESCHSYSEENFTIKGSNRILLKMDEDRYDLLKDIYSTASEEDNSSHVHLIKGVSCKACHGTDMANIQEGAKVENKVCESCHGSQESIAAKTVPSIPQQNPHKSHQGSLGCGICHKPHGTANNYCTSCHQDFQPTMPELKKGNAHGGLNKGH